MRKAYDLRPLDFGDILGRSFSLFTSHFTRFVLLFAFLYLLPVLGFDIVIMPLSTDG